MASTTTTRPSKKPRAGLPLEIELSLPFLSATEDLHQFAAVSRACRDAARESYQKRVKQTTAFLNEEGKSMPANTQPQMIFLPASSQSQAASAHRASSYLKPWWQKQDKQRDGEYFPLIIQDDGSWSLDEEEWGRESTPIMPTCRKLMFPVGHHELLDKDTELVHWSVVDQRLLVILNQWTNRGSEAYNAPETRKQLFAVMYQLDELSSSNNNNNNQTTAQQQQQQDKLFPVFCHKLTDPLDRDTYGSLYGIYFGNAQRSRNGKVVAVVTALPLGNEDNEDDDNYRETAQITVFHVTDTSLEKRCFLEIPIGGRTNDSWLTMTISNGGELLSVNTTQNENEQEYGDWRVYDLMATTAEVEAKVVVKKEEVEKHLLNHQFTPDNQLLIVLPQRDTTVRRGRGGGYDWNPIDETDGTNPNSFFHQVEVPSWLARRTIVVTASERDYNAGGEE